MMEVPDLESNLLVKNIIYGVVLENTTSIENSTLFIAISFRKTNPNFTKLIYVRGMKNYSVYVKDIYFVLFCL